MSVLGKRTRSSAQTSIGVHSRSNRLPPTLTFIDSIEFSTRSKRRSKLSPRHKQHSVDFAIHQDAQNICDDHCRQFTKHYEATDLHEATERVALSPTKANRTCKAQIVSSESKSQDSLKPPDTPRRRDALSKQSPSTPRHRVKLAGTLLTPRTPRTPQHQSQQGKVYKSVYQQAKAAFSSKANGEDQLKPVVGRKSEREELKTFISSHLENKKGAAIYVSGPPGTGKSALLTEITQNMALSESTKCTYLNCMSVKTVKDIYGTLMSGLEISDDVFQNDSKDTLTKAFVNNQRSPTYLVVLDEIDALLDIEVDALYTLFQWSLSSSSRLILIGIANALDLTDRFLPALRARALKPQLLPFLPYTASEIASVLTARLRSLLPKHHLVDASFTPFLMPSAIQLISKKVAAQTGDLRKAFDLARKAIDMIEAETRAKHQQDTPESAHSTPAKTPLGENANLSSPRSPPDTPRKSDKSTTASISTISVEDAPRATISHVVRVTSAAFNNGTKERLRTLNLQQKAVLCSLAALEQRSQRTQDGLRSLFDNPLQPQTGLLPSPTETPPRNRTKMTPSTPTRHTEKKSSLAPRIRDVYEAYEALCTRENMLHALSYNEFRDVISNLEAVGLLSAADGKAGSFTQVVTPSRRGRNGTGVISTKMDDRRVHGSASVDELKQSLESAGVVKSVLERILDGRDL